MLCKVGEGGSLHLREKFTLSRFLCDVVVQAYDEQPQPDHLKDVVRGNIVELSEASRKRLAFVACNTPVKFNSMLTATVQADLKVNSGKVFKSAMKPLLQWLSDRGYPRLWFLEFTERGTPHVHILLSGPVDEKPVIIKGFPVYLDHSRMMSRRWSAYVAKALGVDPELDMFDPVSERLSAMSRASVRWEPIREDEGAAKYVCKYAYKCEQKAVPYLFRDVGRFWGASRGVTPKRCSVESKTWQELIDEGYLFQERHLKEGEVGRPLKIQYGKAKE